MTNPHRSPRAGRRNDHASHALTKAPRPSAVVPIDSGGHRGRVLAARDRLVTDHLSLVDGIARGIARRLPPSFDLEDLIGTGRLALIRAATRYRPSAHGYPPFSAYARIIIHGAIIESVRRKRWIENTRPPIQTEETGDGSHDGALDRLATGPEGEEAIDRRRLIASAARAAHKLPLLERRVLQLYFSERDLTIDEVAGCLEIGRDRARLSLARALATLRGELAA